MTIQALLKKLTKQHKIPTQYGSFDEMVDPPFLVYMGQMPDIFAADNKAYIIKKSYRLEYYFKDKDEQLEETIESLLSSDGWTFSKSDDLYIAKEKIYAVYYYIERIQNYV